MPYKINTISKNQIQLTSKKFSRSNSIIDVTFSQTPLSINEETNVSILFERGYVVKDNAVLLDYSYEMPTHPTAMKLYLRRTYPKPTNKTQVGLCTIPKDLEKNYYHWMINLLPRLLYLQKCKPNMDIITNTISQPFQKEIVAKLGGTHVYTSANTNIVTKKVYIPFQECSFSKEVAYQIPEVEHLRAVKQLFIQKDSKPSLKLYLSRGEAKFRKVLNEKELETALVERGFKIVHLEKLSVQEQANLFNQAKIIVGPHGAGFTNMIFCNKHTIIKEILSPSYLADFYLALADKLNLRYEPSFAKSPLTELFKPALEKNIIIDINKILTEIEAAFSSSNE